MSLAHAIAQTMQAHRLTSAQVAERLGETRDHATFYRMVNGATKEPRLGTLVRLCIALETTPVQRQLELPAYCLTEEYNPSTGCCLMGYLTATRP